VAPLTLPLQIARFPVELLDHRVSQVAVTTLTRRAKGATTDSNGGSEKPALPILSATSSVLINESLDLAAKLFQLLAYQRELLVVIGV
jgi:hypothetical protein